MTHHAQRLESQIRDLKEENQHLRERISLSWFGKIRALIREFRL